MEIQPQNLIETNDSTLKHYHEQLTRKADEVMRIGLGVSFVFGLFLAGFYDTWPVAFGVGGLSLGAYFLVRALLPSKGLYQYVGAVVLAVFMAQFIYQMHGMFEMHFMAFVGALILFSYRNWRLYIPLTLAIATHHSVFAYLQYATDQSVYFTQLEYMDTVTFAFHIGLAGVILGLTAFWAYRTEQMGILGAQNVFSLNSRLSSMDRNIAFAEEISRGNLEAQYGEGEQADEMGSSLLSMREGLLDASQREENEKYKNVGIAEVSDILRKHMGDLDELTGQVLTKLVKYLGANQGGLMLIREEGGESFFEMVACYAYERRKFVEKRIELTEGLIGASFQERDIIYMTDVPDNYVRITSGLGTANPGCLLIVPLMANEEIVGMIELASFDVLKNHQIDFVKRAAESIASTIVSARIGERTNSLLEEARKMTEEMQAQEEEMRQNMEEMQATQEEMRRAQHELREKESNLNALINNTDDTIFAIDSNYNITIVNQTLQRKYAALGVNLDVGRNVFEVIPQDQHDKWRERYDRALNGERFSIMEERNLEDGTHYIETNHYPIVDDDSRVIGVSVMSKDRTEARKQELEVRKRQEDLASLIDSSEDTFFAMDCNYTVTAINRKLREKYEGTDSALKVGMNVFDTMSGDRAEYWRKVYQRVFDGERIREVMSQKLDNGSLIYMEAQCNPITNAQGEVIGCSVIGHDVTNQMASSKELERKESIMSSLIDHTDDTYFAIDNEYRITVANKALRKRFEASDILLKIGDNIFDLLPQEQHAEWKKRYDRVLKGESFQMSQERPVDGKTLTLEVSYQPVKDKEDRIIGASVISRDITRWGTKATGARTKA